MTAKVRLFICITSPIAINDCANAVLALGAKPIMAEHPLEVENITLMSKSLAVSLANITDARAESIMISGKAACKAGIPSVIDLVGVTCSKMRADLCKEIYYTVQTGSYQGKCIRDKGGMWNGI